MIKKYLLFGFLFISHAFLALSQGYMGKEFYVSNMEYYFSCNDTVNFTQGLYISSAHHAKVQFVTPHTLGPYYTATLTPNKAQYFEFNIYAFPYNIYHVEKVSQFVAHLIADSNISVVYAIQTDSFKNYRSKALPLSYPAAVFPMPLNTWLPPTKNTRSLIAWARTSPSWLLK